MMMSRFLLRLRMLTTLLKVPIHAAAAAMTATAGKTTTMTGAIAVTTTNLLPPTFFIHEYENCYLPLPY